MRLTNASLLTRGSDSEVSVRNDWLRVSHALISSGLWQKTGVILPFESLPNTTTRLRICQSTDAQRLLKHALPVPLHRAA